MNGLNVNDLGFFRPPPFGKLRTGFDRLRANGKIVKLMALKPCTPSELDLMVAKLELGN